MFMLESEDMLATSDDRVVDSDDRDDLDKVGEDNGSGPRSAKYG